jgi:hypothetical protein
MGRLKNPILFTREFGIDQNDFSTSGLLDPILNADTRLFIDPILLGASKNAKIKTDGSANFEDYFGKVIQILQHSKNMGDVAWRGAEKLLNLDERPEVCLGYGGNTTRGRRLAKGTKKKVLGTAKEIIDLGIKDPELFSLVGLLEEGVGPDTIGDMTANAILPTLIELTAQTANDLKCKVKTVHIDGRTAKLPYNRYSKKPIILVPKDVLRDLPVASDWFDISAAASENHQIRERVNKFIGDIWKLRTKEQKDRVRSYALTNADAFKVLLDAAYLLKNDSYDFDSDPEGHRIFREALLSVAERFPLKIPRPQNRNQVELRKIVSQILDHFKHLVESNGINYLLWDKSRPRKEKAAQRLFFAVADVYCEANDIDISPETDSGGGPVDFKFSTGYSGRVLVEIKLSTGMVVHGYSTQLAVYENAAKTFESILLIVDVGKLGDKFDRILHAKNERSAKGQRTPDIVLVDATMKPSASRRRRAVAPGR